MAVEQKAINFCTREGTSREKTRHSPRLCLSVPQTLCAVSRQVQTNYNTIQYICMFIQGTTRHHKKISLTGVRAGVPVVKSVS